MRIVWDLTPLSRPATGIGNYIYESFSAAERIAPQHEFVALTFAGRKGGRKVAEYLAELPRRTAIRHHHIWGAAIWRKLINSAPIAFLERLAGPADAFVGSEWFYPRQAAGVRAAVVHDLVPVRFPEYATFWTRRMHLAKVADVKRADVVFCNSAATARDVETLLGIERSRIRVARPGVADLFRDARANGSGPAGGRPYVLSIATVEPRKNLPALLEAFAILRRSHGDLALVLVGGDWSDRRRVDETARSLGLGDALVRTGYVPRERLASILAGARAFCFPSLFEGFGMPVAEALAAGVPVVASAHPSLDEACGPAALRVPATEPEAIAEALERAAFDEREREERAFAGRRHASELTWEACAHAIVSGLEEAATR